jgi:hypothetical protein
VFVTRCELALLKVCTLFSGAERNKSIQRQDREAYSLWYPTLVVLSPLRLPQLSSGSGLAQSAELPHYSSRAIPEFGFWSS